jgi:hypothetical protein
MKKQQSTSMMNRPMTGKTLFAVCVGLFLVLHMPIPTDAHSSNDAGTTTLEEKTQGRFSSFLGGIKNSFKAKETADVGERSLLRQFPDVQSSPVVNPGDNRMTINDDDIEMYHQGDHSVSDMVPSLFRGIKDGLAGKDFGMQAFTQDYDIGNLVNDAAGTNPSPSEEKAQGVDLAARGDGFFHDVVERYLVVSSVLYCVSFRGFSYSYPALAQTSTFIRRLLSHHAKIKPNPLKFVLPLINLAPFVRLTPPTP